MIDLDKVMLEQTTCIQCHDSNVMRSAAKPKPMNIDA